MLEILQKIYVPLPMTEYTLMIFHRALAETGVFSPKHKGQEAGT
jgi:hypothetical protein